MEKFFKTGKAAKLLGVTKRTLERWAKNGTLVPAQTTEGGHNFYSESQILEFKKRDIDVTLSDKNDAGDTTKNATFPEKRDTKRDIGVTTPLIESEKRDTKRDIGVTTPSVENELEDKNQENLSKTGTIPLETVQNRVKNGDIECKNGVTAPSDLSKKCDIEENIDSDVSVVGSDVTVVQIIPTNKLVMPNDKFAKDLFNCSHDEYAIVLRNGGEVVEVKKFPKVGEIVSPYEIKLLDGYSDTLPLTMFDRVVLTACISEWCKGNKVTTPSIIFRHITGNDNGYNIKPSPEMERAILDSVNRMMCTQVTYEMDSACKHLKYNNGQYFKTTAPVLPCKYTTGVSLCGHKSETVIQFYDASPILTIALAKNKQVLTFEKKLLNVPKQHNSVYNISVRHYVVQRVLEIIKHHLTPSITFDDIFKKCNLVDADRMKRSRVRVEIIELLTYMKNSGDIDSFTLKKEGNKYCSIEFSFSDSSSAVSEITKKSKGGYKKNRKQ